MATVGFDFGTTNSLVTVVKDGLLVSLYDDQGLPIPSVVSYEGGKTVVGRQARERLAQAGLVVQGNIVRSPKSLLGQEGVTVGGVERRPVDIVRDVVSYVCQQAKASRRAPGLLVDKAVVTIPVNMEGRRRAALRDAFLMAGVNIVQFVHEPLAALYGHLRSAKDFESIVRRYDRKLILVVDWGGGTLDLTLCRLVDGMLVQVGNDGTDDVGGDVFDEELRNELERRVRAQRKIPEDCLAHSDARTRLIHNCERAKIDLSNRNRVNLFVSNFFRDLEDSDLDLQLTKDELEAIVGHLIRKGVARIERLLDGQGYSPASISLCLATGGMSEMPAIRARLHELFGPERVHISERSAALISEGAAWVAHDSAGLRLAKNVELVLARNSYMPLLAAGIGMPLAGQVQRADYSLYCVDPTDGFGKFEITTPHRPGPQVLPGEPRRPLANLVVPVDKKAQPFRERLNLNLSIDENLILRAVAKSLDVKSRAEAEVHDLEFALALPGARAQWGQDGEPDLLAKNMSGVRQLGGLAMRSNIANHESKTLVPGEILEAIDPGYFDARANPPQVQVEECLYYAPCAVCGRASNDLLCRCATSARTVPVELMRAGHGGNWRPRLG